MFTLCMIAGWRPRRTIIFASWDAEEFGLLGSTEWAEVKMTRGSCYFLGQQETLRVFPDEHRSIPLSKVLLIWRKTQEFKK